MYSPSQGGGRPKQSRIVINVDDAKRKGQPGGARRGAGGRRRALAVVALVIVGLLLAVLGGGFWWWQSYKKSPGYSLALLADAAQRDDVQTVEQLLDSERVAQSLAPQVLDRAVANADGMGALPMPRKQIEAALPNILHGVHEQTRAELMRAVKEATAKTSQLPFFVRAVGASQLWDSMKQEGDTATILFKRDPNQPPSELTMQRAGDLWKVVGLKDEQLAARIASDMVRGLAVPPALNNQPNTNNDARRQRRRGNN